MVSVLALIVKIRKSQNLLAPISGSPGDQIFFTNFQKFNLNILKRSFMEYGNTAILQLNNT